MKKGAAIALIIIAILLVAGICVSLLIGSGMQIKALGMMEPRTVTHTPTESFLNIDVRTVEAEIRLLSSLDGTCRVVCEETDKITHTVAVENGTLTVRRQDGRAWYERFGLNFQPLSVSVYLPQEAYASLTLESVSGGIEVASTLLFEKTDLGSTSGSIISHARTSGDLIAATVSGSITLTQQAGGRVTVSSTSGKIDMKNISAAFVSAETTSGRISMENVLSADLLQAESVSGRVQLTRVDGKSLHVSTVSGGITATLLTGKVFSYDTVSGTVSLPPSTAGAGTCHLETTSGSIHVSLAE